MSKNDPLIRFHKYELDGLKELRIYARAVCKQLRRLFKAIRDDKPLLAARPIGEFLHPDGLHSPFGQCLEKTRHLIQPVAIPTEFPFHSGEVHTQDGHRVPTLTAIHTADSAHEAAERVSVPLEMYFQSKMPSQHRYRDLSLEYFSTAGELIEDHWQEICSELGPVCKFDVDALEEAIEKEHQLAIERCRDSVLTSATGMALERGDAAKDISKTQAGNVEDDGTLQPTPVGTDDRKLGEEILAEDPPPFTFMPSGDGYEIFAFDEHGHFSIRGFKYIRRLIETPGVPVPTVELIAGIKDEKTDTADKGPNAPILDKTAQKELYERYQKIQEELKDAPTDEDRANLENERDHIENQLLIATGTISMDGAVRTLDPAAEKRQMKVHNALSRAYAKLRTAKPPCQKIAEHFETSISAVMSVCFIYDPAKRSPEDNLDVPEWQFS